MALTPGTCLGPYEILSAIGSGGMGEVYKAHDTRLDRDVAIKVLPLEFARDSDRFARLEQEARATAALNHPNIVAVHDIGTHEGAPFIVMELLEGATLRERLSAGPLTTRKAVTYGVQIASGLAAAHNRGIVHRDLKPENVFVTRDGRLKILDFGLARIATAGRGDVSVATGMVQTADGLVMGTVGYMAPEQVRGQTADHRADIFACGTMLYEMFAGRRAFTGASAVETMNAILTQDPAEMATDGVRSVSPALDRVVRRCMEKAPDERLQSAQDLAFALEAVSSGSGVSEAQTAAGQPGILRYAPVVAALAVIAAAIAILWPRPPADTETLTFSQLTWDAGVESFPSLSPDGKWLVYAGSNAGNSDIYLLGVGASSPINLTKDSPVSDTQPAFSSDGETIAFRSDRDGGGVFLMGRTGDSVRRLTNAGFNPAWSPDGKSIAVASETFTDPTLRNARSSVSIVDVSTGQIREVVPKAVDAIQPSWSPHGQRIAFWNSFRAGGRRDIWTVSSAGGAPTQVTDDAALDWNPVWSADGRALYFLSDRSGSMNIWRIEIDETTGAPKGAPRPLQAPAQYVAHLAIGDAGRRLAYASFDERLPIVRVSLDSQRDRVVGSPEAVTTGSRRWLAGMESPDGALLALSTVGQQEDIYVSRSDGSAMRQLTNDAARDRVPHWSPDGKRLVFYSNRGGDYRIWTMNVDGSALTKLETGDVVAWNRPIWSPDGKRMSAATLTGDSYLIDPLDPSSLVKLPAVEGGFDATAWSPDGRHLAGPRTGDVGGLLIYSLETRTYDRLTDDGLFPGWLDNNRLVYRSSNGELLMVVDRATKRTRTLWSFAPDFVGIPKVVPGSRHIYMSVRHRESDLWMATVGK